MMPATDLFVIGAGIAGCCVAYFARQAGFRVTIVDAGVHRASAVPTALINPVRGKQGYFVKGGDVAARATFALIDALIAQGHAIVHGKGVWRPVPDAATYDKWCSTLPATYPHRWHLPAPAELALQGDWHAALYLPEAGWVDTASFLSALQSASAAAMVHGEVASIDMPERWIDDAAINISNMAANAANPSSKNQLVQIQLRDGRQLSAQQLVWCGGAYGAHCLLQESAGKLAKAARFQPGQIIKLAQAIAPQPVSYGLFAAPWLANGQVTPLGNSIGPSTEYASDNFASAIASSSASTALHKLRERVIDLFSHADAATLAATSSWQGVRLAQVTLPVTLPNLTGLGSKGYLLAPMLAKALVDQMVSHHAPSPA